MQSFPAVSERLGGLTAPLDCSEVTKAEPLSAYSVYQLGPLTTNSKQVAA